MSDKNLFITQAFKQFSEILDEELDTDAGVQEVPVYSANTDNMHEFLDTAGEDEPVDIIDLEAETVEDLKQSYVGKVVLDCNVCHSNIFIDKDEVTVDENGVANIDMECPYCISNEGYTVIGKIAPYEDEEEVPEEEPLEEVEVDASEEEIEEGLISRKEHAKGYSNVYTDVEKGITSDIEADVVTDELDKQLKEGVDSEDDTNECGDSDKLEECGDTEKIDECGDTETVQEELELDGEPELRGVGKLRHRDDKEGVEEIRGKNNTDLSGTDDLHESIQDVQITTDDETMTMTTKEDGGVAVETTPNEPEETFEETEEIAEENPELEEGDEVIVPIDDDEEDEIELNSEVDALSDEEVEELETPDEVEINEFDEDSFDELGESYLTSQYDNVEGFKTVNAKVINDSLIVEGVIRFNSGNSKCTSFVFEASQFNSKTKSALFEGYNNQISRGKKTFKMNCSINEGKVTPTKLSYNYRAKNELNESIRVNGTAKVKR